MIQRLWRLCPLSLLASFNTSVRVRLALWYLMITIIALIMFSGSLYSMESSFRDSIIDAQLETPLYQDGQRLSNIYKQALLHGQQPSSRQVTLSSGEIALLLRPNGTILDRRGPLTDSAIRQLQARAGNSQSLFNMTLPLTGTNRQHATNSEYRLLITPILDNNTRVAILMVGLVHQSPVHVWSFWLPHVFLILIIGTIGGYWLASKAMRPVQMITRMANEINATDLRRRLNLKRRDEFGELAATFDGMLARLEAAFKRQTQFTADASHELRTPLTIMGLEINRALTQARTPEEYRQVLEQIQNEQEHMAYIVNNLLLLARADTGHLELQREEVDLSDIALACVERLLSLARQSHVAISTGELPELLVSGDPQYLSRMLLNLIENAIKYTSGTGTRVHVDLACEQGRWGVIRVQDDGPGIAEEHLPYLFDRFYRVDRARSRSPQGPSDAVADSGKPGGTGLGLAIVQWIVQAHQGEVRVESKIGAGSTFEVRLPLLKQENAASALIKKSAPLSNPLSP